jgi:hypothetical protein
MIQHEEFLKRLARHADAPEAALPTQTPTEFTACVPARLRDLQHDTAWARLATRACRLLLLLPQRCCRSRWTS